MRMEKEIPTSQVNPLEEIKLTFFYLFENN